jgi:AcrR family transcriptional regulator
MFGNVRSSDRSGIRRPQQLPPGRHGLTRSFVERNQRERILAGVAMEASESGYAAMTVESIISRAGVSRRTFYEHFKNKHEAYLAAYDEAAARLVRRVVTAVETVEGFVRRTEKGLGALLSFLAADPAVARMCIVEVMAAGPEAIDRRAESVRAFATLVDGHARDLLDEQVPLLTAETIVGGIYEVVYTRVLRDETTSLPELLPDLVYSALLPYLGQSAALAERRRMLAERPAAG